MGGLVGATAELAESVEEAAPAAPIDPKVAKGDATPAAEAEPKPEVEGAPEVKSINFVSCEKDNAAIREIYCEGDEPAAAEEGTARAGTRSASIVYSLTLGGRGGSGRG